MLIEGLYIVRNPGPHSTLDDIKWYVRDLRHLATLIFGSPPYAVEEEHWAAYTNNVEATKDANKRLARRAPEWGSRGRGAGGKARKNANAPRCPRCGGPMRRAVTGVGWFCARKSCGEFKSDAPRGGKRRASGAGLIAAATALKQAMKG